MHRRDPKQIPKKNSLRVTLGPEFWLFWGFLKIFTLECVRVCVSCRNYRFSRSDLQFKFESQGTLPLFIFLASFAPISIHPHMHTTLTDLDCYNLDEIAELFPVFIYRLLHQNCLVWVQECKRARLLDLGLGFGLLAEVNASVVLVCHTSWVSMDPPGNSFIWILANWETLFILQAKPLHSNSSVLYFWWKT